MPIPFLFSIRYDDSRAMELISSVNALLASRYLFSYSFHVYVSERSCIH